MKNKMPILVSHQIFENALVGRGRSIFWNMPPPPPLTVEEEKNTYVGGVIQFTLTNKIEVSLYKNYMVLALSPL